MIPVHSDIVSFKGTHYNFGYKQGEILKNSPIMKHREKLWKQKRERHFLINRETYQSVIKQFIPPVWDELHGLADALQLPIDEAIIQFGGYYLEYGRSGCSIFTTDQFMIRNYDNHPNSYEGRYVIYEPTDEGFTTVGPSMQITGRTDGMNEKGLAMGYNFVNRRQSKDGFVCNMIGRIILETCANVQEAIDLLKEIPHRHSFNYVLTDPSGVTYVVEASPRRVVAHQNFVCTNHFHYLTDENRYRMDDSLKRERLISNKGNNNIDMLQAFHLLNDDKYDIFSHDYGAYNGTLHTAIYSPKQKKIGIALGKQDYPLILDFEKLLDVSSIRIKQLKGTIKYRHPFINVNF